MNNLIFFPVLAQIVLTSAIFVALAVAKSKAIASGEVNEDRRALYGDAWPEYVIQINNNLRNQFELPVLFYVLCFMLWALDVTTTAIHVLAWLFVGSRVVHAFIHTGSNFVPLRRNVFMFGFLIVVVMAVWVLITLWETLSL